MLDIWFEQPSTEVKALYGDEVMGNDDYWQVFLDDAKYELYFVENDDGTMMLAELEIEFFWIPAARKTKTDLSRRRWKVKPMLTTI